MHYSHDKFYYIVTLGSAKGSMKNPLLKGNVTELPKEIVDSIRSETTPLEANAILWDVVTWKEKPVARKNIVRLWRKITKSTGFRIHQISERN
jgi:hypothetical protein